MASGQSPEGGTLMMARTRLHLPAALLALSLAAAPAPADEPPPLTADTFNRLREQLHVKGQPWATIPWRTSVTAAREQAARERKPIFLVVNTGNCLGRV
jgi:hypothetical protein